MRLGGILQAAIEILESAEISSSQISDIIKKWGVSHRFAGSKDRAVISNIVYHALRNKLSLQYKIASNTARSLAYSALLDQGKYTLEELEYALKQDKFAPPLLDAAQQQAWLQTDLEKAPLFVQANIPSWLVSSMEANLGAEWINEGKALTHRPPLDIRINKIKTDRLKVEQYFEIYQPQRTKLTPYGLRITKTDKIGRLPNIQSDSIFQNGWFEIQDIGSQLAARLSKVSPGVQVLDYCAGGGGKTLALAAEMENRGQIHAYDAHKNRLMPIYERIKRAGLHNVQVHTQSTSLNPLLGSMNCVLLDAPCSGTGTWRRHPDTKWQLKQETLTKRLNEQKQVLKKGAQFVKQGGRLVYVTCSLLYEENDAQIKQFLQENATFKLVDTQKQWQHVLTPSEKSYPQSEIDSTYIEYNSQVLPYFTTYGVAFSPHKTQTDGFFVSIMEKCA